MTSAEKEILRKDWLIVEHDLQYSINITSQRQRTKQPPTHK